MIDKMKQAAFTYAEIGWSVLPLHSIVDGHCTCGRSDCGSAGKHPRTPHGVQDAAADIDTINKWWDEWPDANVGIATGAISGFFVLDVDGETGERSLAELQSKYGQLPDTLETITGGGGRHLLFQYPNKRIKNKVSLTHGLDIRGDGGYIVGPPSTHKSGRNYEWKNYDIAMAEAPDWLINLISETNNYSKLGQIVSIPDLVLLDGVPEGERDNMIFRYACRLRAKGLKREEVETLVLQAAARCKPPFPEKEALAKVDSAWRYSQTFKLSDAGNADRFIALHGQDVRYCEPWKKWLVWDGRRWALDNTNRVLIKAIETAEQIELEAEGEEDKDKREKILKWATISQRENHIQAMTRLAKGKLAILPEQLDTDPWLLNVRNGTIDLRTGKLRPHRREDYITQMVDVDYDEDAKCPRWDQFLREVMLDNEDMVKFLQRAAGMSLTGVIKDHVLLVLYGTGRNGKSTFLNTLLKILLDYGLKSPANLLIAGNSEQHPTVYASLFGKRMVVVSETDRGQRLSESIVKDITGNDIMTARRMREDYWQFVPTHHIWLATNYKPRIYGTDAGIWSRIKLIPFMAQFLDEDKTRDPDLPEKLLQEKAGILRWLVEGALLWQQQGLGEPPAVKEATEEYKTEQDIIEAFLSDECERDENATETVQRVYSYYLRWCEDNGERPIAKRELSIRLKERGFETARGTHNVWIWKGLRLIEHELPL